MMSNALSCPALAGACRGGLLSGLSAVSALPALAANPSAQSQPAVSVELPPLLLTLNAIGLCVLAVWLARRIARPRKLALTRSPGRPNRVNILHLLGVLGAWVLFIALADAVAPKSLAGEPGHARPEYLLARTAVAQVVWIAAALLVGHYAFRHGLGRGLGFAGRHWLCDAVRGALAYLTVLPICTGLFLLTILLLPPEYQKLHALLQYYKTLPVGWKALVVVSAVVLAPLSEELFFRGLIQSMVRHLTGSPWAAIAVSTILFGAIHYDQPQAIPALLALAVALGYNYERTGRLFAPIVIHVVFNAVNILAWAIS